MKEGTPEYDKPEGRFTRKKKPKLFFSDIQKNFRADSCFWETQKGHWFSHLKHVFTEEDLRGRKEESQIYPGSFNIKQWKKK